MTLIGSSEPPACTWVIGDALHIGDLFHPQRALQGPEFSEIASAYRLTLGRETNRRFICNGCFDRQKASQYQ